MYVYITYMDSDSSINGNASDSNVEQESGKQYVYLLECDDGATYVGATKNLDRRLRQHNKEIKGGATATGTKVAQGKKWRRVCYVSGFPTWQAALQFEWRWKQLSRKLCGTPIERRQLALDELLSLEKSTSAAIPYKQWATPPEIHFD